MARKSNNVVPFHPDYLDGANLVRENSGSSRTKQIQLERDWLRLQIKSLWHMEEIYNLLGRDWMIPTPEERYAAEQAGVTLRTATRVNQYSKKLDYHFKMLNKVLPDQSLHQVDAQVETTAKTTGPQQVHIVSFGTREDTKLVTQQTKDTQATSAQQKKERSAHGVQEDQQEKQPEVSEPKAKTISASYTPRVKSLTADELERMPWLK